MTRRNFIALISLFSISSSKVFAAKNKIQIDFIRHATFILRVGGVNILVDPMLSNKGEMDAVGNAPRTERIPMVPLPFPETSIKEKLGNIDAVMITHTHRDHWDVKAQSILNKETTLICQPPDAEKLKQQGFSNLISVMEVVDFKGLKIFRVGGQHGTGEIGTRMGPVSGFVIAYGKKKIYVAGDTVWCSEVEQTISIHKPDMIVVNAGAAQFNQGDPITMTSKDVIRVINAQPSAIVVAVHMETVNHCLLTRSDLKNELESANLSKRSRIPNDGESIYIT